MWHMQNFAVWQAISILQAVVMHEEHLHKTKLHAAYYYQRKICWRQGCTKIFKRRYKKIYPWNELSISEHIWYSTDFPAMDLPCQANLVFHKYSMSHGWMDITKTTLWVAWIWIRFVAVMCQNFACYKQVLYSSKIAFHFFRRITVE